MSATGIVEGQLGRVRDAVPADQGHRRVLRVGHEGRRDARVGGARGRLRDQEVLRGRRLRDRLVVRLQVQGPQGRGRGHPAGERDALEGLHDRDRDLQPAELALDARSRRRPTWPRASATTLCAQRRRGPRGQPRRVPDLASARSTRSHTSAASPVPSQSASPRSAVRDRSTASRASRATSAAASDSLNVLEGVYAERRRVRRQRGRLAGLQRLRHGPPRGRRRPRLAATCPTRVVSVTLARRRRR